MSPPFPAEPLSFRPLLMERVWGGGRLKSLFGKPAPEGRVIGESWELSDRPEAQSVAADGPLAGMTFRQILETWPREVLGDLAVAHPECFPLLVKFVDAAQPLSVQVHPDDAGARAFGDSGKCECWVVLYAEPGAQVVRGLKPGTTRADFERAIAEDRVEGLLHTFAPQAGDVIALPPGMVHALGGGLVVAEIQQNSDLTFRIYDYKRLGLDGKPRKLYIAEALAAIRFDDPGGEIAGDMRADTVQPVTLGRGSELLVKSAYFHLARLTLAPGATVPLHPASVPRVIMILSGAGALDGRFVCGGQTRLLPAAAQRLRLSADRAEPLVALVAAPELR